MPALSRRAVLLGTFQTLVSLAACATPLPAPLVTAQPTTHSHPEADPTSQAAAACTAGLPAVIPPTPIPYPGSGQPEPSTGLHVIGKTQRVDLASYRLQVTGKVDRPLSLSYDDIRCLPRVQAHVTLECPGFFVDPVDLAGTTLAEVVGLASPQPDATLVALSSVDNYTRYLRLEEALMPRNFLAYQWKDQPLPASHGFPLRAAIPDQAGSQWVKWLVRIELR